ncbi:hypothetical protein ASG11_03680 [Sphingomonas sp. Leaf357]|uniref:hypothetical protein n=1 Tax=Sphingomonas sp. Leaf357 TaxID=1736350 RepID=UPI0006FAC14E|nr:hypothetical protein [Sphingomonas sp. Leaf357]KQS03473.1 hypothetical protein ASG11_03680 [Sphingomonas sp. Leaf357]
MTRWFAIPDTLPTLTGWPARFYGVLWVAVLAITLIGVSGGAWHQLRYGAGSAYGLDMLGISIGRDARIDRLGGDEMRNADVRIGDRVLSLARLAIPSAGPDSSFSDRIRLRAERSGGSIPMVIQRGQAPPRKVKLTRGLANGEALYAGTGLTPVSLTWSSALVGLAAPVVMVFGAILLFGRRRDPVAALLSLSLLSLATGFSFASVFWKYHPGGMWVVTIVPAIGTLGMLLAMQAFPNGKLEPHWTRYLMAATTVIAIGGIFLPPLGTIGLILLTPLTVLTMVIRYRSETPVARQQWRWAMIGFVSGIVLLTGGAFGYNAYLSSHRDFGSELWSWIVTPLILAVPLTIIVAGVVLSVLRYRLYDTQAAVSRSILLGILTLALLAIFAGSEKIIELVGERYLGESMGALAGALGAAFAAVAIVPLHHKIGHWVEHRFRRNLIHLRHDLPPLLTELGETSDPATVARTALSHLAHDLHAMRGAVIADGEVLAAHVIEADEIDLRFADDTPRRAGTIEMRKRDPLFPVRIPLAADKKHWLLIGARPDGSLYDRQERELLSDLAVPLAQALRISAVRAHR